MHTAGNHSQETEQVKGKCLKKQVKRNVNGVNMKQFNLQFHRFIPQMNINRATRKNEKNKNKEKK